MLFSSLPVFFSVYIPLVVLVFFAIIFEDRLIKIEQRLFCRLKRRLTASKRKNAPASKRPSAAAPSSARKREQLKRVA